MASTPIWTWLPDATEPTLAGDFELEQDRGVVRYEPAYMETPHAVPLDPVALPFTKRIKGMSFQSNGGIPGVILDAAPAGYGADRLKAVAKRELNVLELLQAGLADGAGAIEVCADIDRKIDTWRPPAIKDLMDRVEELEDTAPASRAIRRLLEDESTSAGGERPKVTVQDGERLWLAKMQDRGDVPHLPAKEFVVMDLAREAGLSVPQIQLLGDGKRKVYLIERFDRGGSPFKPTRMHYASAHTILGLDGSGDHDNPRRSYLVIADMLRRWQKKAGHVGDLHELWRRMAFNALVGNTDDHPRNHAFIFSKGVWRLSPAFDITPQPKTAGLLSLACDEYGSRECTPERLLRSASHFELDMESAVAWLTRAATLVASEWAKRMHAVNVDADAIKYVAPAFKLSHMLAENADAIYKAAEAASARPDRRSRR
ncbi:MAG: HipA domain-containing protein [Polaromonas sp.]|uniref:type II toxin-antitoxin system HipA family toxin n=2 Tax=Polaromonas sp. TaxID=1869339 RepID=UPI00271E4E9F|nr:HipA domain-containing protein [Polaromonas sp.]MDO9112438.1 HipA domain-containing protein [Polaromonas sp.]MDP1884886.1 HipA domain-containing protein [Polaromonas sp.]